MARKTLYLMLDTETTMKNGLVFDAAFELFDKRGNTLEHGSYLFKDVLAVEEPYYKDKISQYWTLSYKGLVRPVMFRTFRRIFNGILERYTKQGFKVVICAYNASFDLKHLALNAKVLLKRAKFLTHESKNVLFLDLWHAWVMGCPIDYGYTAPFVHGDMAGQPDPKKPGNYLSWNIKTSAEAVYKYITDNHTFEEKHIAHSDILIEKIILMDVLRRKKKLPVVDNPVNFQAMPWKIAQERCMVPIAERRKRRMEVMETIVNSVPDLTTRGNHMTDQPTILFPGE